MTRYRTIVADPPWDHSDGFAYMANRPGSKERKAGADTTVGRRTIKPMPYKAMSLAEIQALQVGKLADARGCNLFLWTTNRYLPHAFGVATAWGFSFRQMVVWSKPPGSRPPFRTVVAPNCAEFLLVCRSGSGARLREPWPSNVVEAHRQGVTLSAPLQHSQKPEVFLDLIEQVSPGPYLELFSRRARLGWDTWGNEALEHVDLGSA